MIDLTNLTYTENAPFNGVKSICSGVSLRHTICVNVDGGKEAEDIAKASIQHALYIGIYGELRSRLLNLRMSIAMASNPQAIEAAVAELDKIIETLYPPKKP